VLFDTGATPDGLVENMRRMDLSPGDIEAIVLSHGHSDHTTGMDGLARALGRTNLPVLIHPEFWNRRRLSFPGREPFELPTTSKGALEDAGFEIVEDVRPSFLLDGSLLITGEVDRTTPFERGMPGQQAFKGGEWVPDPLILDDQGLLVNVRDKGLVILTGCGHSGIVNVVRYARKITGIDKVHAIIGGFHLGGPAFEPIIPETVESLVAFDPGVLVPTHCTGFKAIHALAKSLPGAFHQSSVLTTFAL
jgi:7,8-dihydropterin-6-yl-methyl-4-(beta-D-ribofuranosyl)aminobenzene 5'-phosphate synthase